MKTEEPNYRITVFDLPDDYEGTVRATLLNLPAERPATSAVLYLHGYLDYYFQHHMGQFFARHGHNFYALDLRKYGRSWMPHQHFNYCRSLTEYYPEIDRAIDRILADGNCDITLIGHSTGGLLASLYCAEGNRRAFVNRLILNSPFLEFNAGWLTSRVVIPIASAIGHHWPYASVRNVLPPNYFDSVHESRHGEWQFDASWKPAQLPPLWLAWVRAVRLAQRKVKRGLGLAIPVLVMFSDKSSWHRKWHDEAMTSDTILDVWHIRHYGARLGNNVTLSEIRDGMHDLVLSRADVRAGVLTRMEYFIERTSKECTPAGKSDGKA